MLDFSASLVLTEASRIIYLHQRLEIMLSEMEEYELSRARKTEEKRDVSLSFSLLLKLFSLGELENENENFNTNIWPCMRIMS